jgi:cell division protein FtsB
MARQVPQRNKLQLILLVTFAILFVIATILAILGLVNYDQAKHQNQELTTRMDSLQGDNAKLQSDTGELIMLVTGKAGTIASAKAAAKAAYLYTAEAGGLAPELVTMAQSVKDKVELIAKLNADITQLRQQIELQKKLQADLIAARQKDRKAFQDKEAKLNAALVEEQKKRDEVFTQAKGNVVRTRKSLQRTIRAQTRQIEKITEDNQAKTNEITKLRNQIDKLTRTSHSGTELVLRPGCTIRKLVRADGICYLDKGTADNVRRGMTFAVYPAGAAGTSGAQAKGSIRVIRPMDDISECAIVQEKPANPIVQGDIISNIANQASRVRVFVVAGVFDLHNTGQATTRDAEEVENVIRRAGGKIAKKITVQTDYVVLGVAPSRPAAPAPDALEATRRAYQRQQKLYDDYIALKNQAKAMGIPILNTNRFMELTGYKPEPVAE